MEPVPGSSLKRGTEDPLERIKLCNRMTANYTNLPWIPSMFSPAWYQILSLEFSSECDTSFLLSRRDCAAQLLNAVAPSEESLGFSQLQVSNSKMLAVVKWKWVWGEGLSAQEDEQGDEGSGHGQRLAGGRLHRCGIWGASTVAQASTWVAGFDGAALKA